MKVLAVVGLFLLFLAFLIAPWRFVFTRGWGRSSSYWLFWVTLAFCTGHLALTVALYD